MTYEFKIILYRWTDGHLYIEEYKHLDLDTAMAEVALLETSEYHVLKVVDRIGRVVFEHKKPPHHKHHEPDYC